MSGWDLPDCGVVFWPVGNGDAVTAVIDDETIIQIDISHCDKANDDDDDRVPVVDRLVELLPTPPGADKPTLTVLAISHHDTDHCSGFAHMIDEVNVNEMWITLRSFVEEKDTPGGLTTAGQAVYDEACRRRKAEIDAHARGERAKEGDRLLVIGNADALDDNDWSGFPEDLLVSAGNLVAMVNAQDITDRAEIFIHTPFRDDTQDGSRNSSSLGMQLMLKTSECTQRFLLLGDLEYEQIDAIFDKSEERGNEDRLAWDVLLAPHHCSRNAVRRREGDDWVDADAADDLATYAAEGAKVIVSSEAFGTASAGDTDPPHDDAREVYERIVGADNVICTADYANGSDSEPVAILVGGDECGSLEETKSARLARMKTIGVIKSGAAVRSGDDKTGTGDQEFAK